jgi:single-strand DNA-binding protein
MSDLNRVTLVGRLTRDPEIRYTAGGMPIVGLGLAVNGRQKDASGQWVEKPNFFDVKLFGERFERLAQHLEKGRRIGVDGRLEWSSWETDGQKRSKIEIVANELQFLDGRGDGDGNSGGGARRQQFGAEGESDIAPDTSDFVPVGSGGGAPNDDDIPF